jgi:hypothetical protein
MPTARQSAANSFYIDDEGNVQRVPTRGTYGFRGWWEKSKDFSGGLPADYDWKTLDRPKIERAPAGPVHRPKPIQQAKTLKEQHWKGKPGQPGRDYGPPQEQDISGFASDPSPRFGNRQRVAGPETDFNDPRRAHNLTNVRVTGMTTSPFGEMGESRGALPRGSQFAGTYIEEPTGLPSQLAIGPGGGRFPAAIDTTAT